MKWQCPACGRMNHGKPVRCACGRRVSTTSSNRYSDDDYDTDVLIQVILEEAYYPSSSSNSYDSSSSSNSYSSSDSSSDSSSSD